MSGRASLSRMHKRLRNHMNNDELTSGARLLLVAAVLGWWGTTACARADEVAPPMAVEQKSVVPAWAADLGAAIEQLERQGFAIEAGTAYEAALTAVLQAMDPLATPLTEATREAVAQRRAGTVYRAPFDIGLTNESVRIVAAYPDPEPEEVPDWVGHELVRVAAQDVTALGLHQIENMLVSDGPGVVEVVTRRFNDGRMLTTQRLERVAHTLPDLKPAEKLPFDLGYLRIQRLRDGIGSRVVDQLSTWAKGGLYGLVLDLRGADGEALKEVQQIADWFAQEGTLLYALRDALDQDIELVYAQHDYYLGMPVMVLLDEETGGAAEVLAAILKDSVRGAMLFGRTSRGDFLLREPVQVDADQKWMLAASRLVTAQGTMYTGRTGVSPDVRVAADERTPARSIRSGRTVVLEEERAQVAMYNRIRGDATLRRAVDVLLGLKALDIRPAGHHPQSSR